MRLLPKILLYYLQQELSMTNVLIFEAGYFDVALDAANHSRVEVKTETFRTDSVLWCVALNSDMLRYPGLLMTFLQRVVRAYIYSSPTCL